MDEDIKNVRREQQDISCTEQKKRRIPYSYEEAIKELDEKLERIKARKRDLAARRLNNEKGPHTMYKFYFTKQIDTLKKKIGVVRKYFSLTWKGEKH